MSVPSDAAQIDTGQAVVRERTTAPPLALYAGTTFLSAFLLFQIQPLMARILLPWFGGTAAVWTTCVLFFQAALLLGYAYAHGALRLPQVGVQRTTHLALLVASVLALHVLPPAGWKPGALADPSLRIIGTLLGTVGLPYLLLSSSSPLLQAWFAAGQNGGASSRVYRLFALSNAGSLLGLLSYPVLVEPFFTLRQQALLWSAGYLAYAALCGVIAWRLPAATLLSPSKEEGAQQPGGGRPALRLYVYWTVLAAASSTLMLAITTHLTQNVAAIPLLWVLPLGAYLISFIVCFGARRWRWRRGFLPLPAVFLAGMAYGLSDDMRHASLFILIPLFTIGLYVCCVVCHGELARSRPPTRYLTSFYLTVSFGGALGGLFVGVLAPHLFKGYYELPIGLALVALISVLALYWQPGTPWWKDGGWISMAALAGLLLFFLGKQQSEHDKQYRFMARNYYGVLQVQDPDDPKDREATRSLFHGTILHGEQFVQSDRNMEPTTYYAPTTGVGLTIHAFQKQGPLRMGVIGLGTGTLAAYGRPGDTIRFYDINPLVPQIARSQFSILSGSKAHIDIVMGDARLSLEREPPQGYDLLAVDAFSSDAIPVHLLTREAFQVYFRHLKPGGVLAVHVSNRYLALAPVAAQIAQAIGKKVRMVENADDSDTDTAASTWVLVTADPAIFRSPLLKSAAVPVEIPRGQRLWTDDYSNVLQALRYTE